MKINRDYYLNKLIRHKHNSFIKIISGVRRCGKSYLLFELFKNHLRKEGIPESHIISLQLDNQKHFKYRDPDTCYNYIESQIQDENMHYLLIDEIQFMKNFEGVLNGCLYLKNVDVYVTGSNSKFLSSDVVTEFRGRGDEIRIYPLNFAEYYSVVGGDWNLAWDQYCIYGGMPSLFQFDTNEDKASYLKNLFKETYLKDVIERNKIANKIELEHLLNIIASNIGGLTSVKKLSNSFRSVADISISEPTLTKYMEYLLDAFLISKVQRYDVKEKRYLNSPCKYYFVDPGIRNTRLEFRQTETNHIMENVIYNELAIRGYQIDVGNVSIRERAANNIYTKKQLEVDFVVNLGTKRYYIQSAQQISNLEKIKQKKRPLVNIRDSFRKIIIFENNIVPRYDEDGIAFIGLKDFLLNPEIINF